MSAIRNRLRALEGQVRLSAGDGRVYCVVGDGDGEALADFVQSEGWAYDADRDLIIHRTLVTPNQMPHEANPLRFSRTPSNPAWRNVP